MSGAAVALRLARRELTRAPGRALLAVVMVALPVTAVSAADVLLQTELREDSRAATPPDLGPTAEALLRDVTGGRGRVTQDPTGTEYGVEGAPGPRVTDAEVLALLPAGSRLLVVERGIAGIALPDGPGRVRAVVADAADPALAGRFEVARGRLPSAPGEVAVGPALVDAGLDVGATTTDDAGRTLRVVGALPDAEPFRPQLLLAPGSGALERDPSAPDGRDLYVESPAPVTLDDVAGLNGIGLVVTSRSVLRDPPPVQEQPADRVVGVDALIVAMAAAMGVLQVVLLAGPAFAVGARRQRFALAQLAAAGGRPRDGQRVVLAGALLLGTAGALAGIAAGLGIARLARALVDDLAEKPAGPLPVLDLALIVAIAVGSAVLAAVVPARGAARQDPVAVLSQRPERARQRRLPVLLGVVLLAVGVLAAADAARGADEVAVALSAVPTVLGAVLLAPVALVLLSRVRGLPFALRYPVRDAARQRSRTAPAVGAVTAVVAAAVALGIGGASDAEQARVEGRSGTAGPGVTAIAGSVPSEEVWERVAAAVRRTAPGLPVTGVRGLPDTTPDFPVVCPAGAPDDLGCQGFLSGGFGSGLGSTLLAGPEALAALGSTGTPEQRERAAQVLAAGGIVVLTDTGARPDRVRVRLGERVTTAPAAALDVVGFAPALAVVSDAVATELALPVRTTALVVGGDLDGPTRQRVEAAVALRAPEAFLSQPDGDVSSDERAARIALLVLGAVAGVLVLGGALASTALVLAEAKPEFTTLGTLGASGSTRRRLAAGYAATISLVGAVLGTLAGVVPGIAVAFPLTSNGGLRTGLLPRYLDVPWLLVATLVVGVPLLAAAVAALTARGGLPGRERRALT